MSENNTDSNRNFDVDFMNYWKIWIISTYPFLKQEDKKIVFGDE